jgi:hypothetical protein
MRLSLEENSVNKDVVYFSHTVCLWDPDPDSRTVLLDPGPSNNVLALWLSIMVSSLSSIDPDPVNTGLC